MKKLVSYLVIVALSFCCAVVTTVSLDYHNKELIKEIAKNNPNELRYDDSYEKSKSHLALTEAMSADTIPLMGSSELSSSDGYPSHPHELINYSNLNILFIGAGNFQSLIDAITLGSIEKSLPQRKINLIVSMQWFEDHGTYVDAFQARMSFDHLYYFLNNPHISESTKEAALQRIYTLSKGNDSFESQVKLIDSTRKSFSISKYLGLAFHEQYAYSNNAEAAKKLQAHKHRQLTEIKTPINWDKVREHAIQLGKEQTTNNDYMVNNDYWNTYVLPQDNHAKGLYKNMRFNSKEEFHDLEIFLQTAKDLNIEVNLFLIPIPQRWATYAELPQSSIDEYQSLMKATTEKYNNVRVFNYQKYAGKPYFFKDILHIGHNGWTYLLPDLLEANGFGRFNGSDTTK